MALNQKTEEQDAIPVTIISRRQEGDWTIVHWSDGEVGVSVPTDTIRAVKIDSQNPVVGNQP
jgi:hypothetical protein